MGNYISCVFLAPKLKTPKSARVILPGGEIRQFRHSVKAAELMLEAPGFFLVNSESLNIGRRFLRLSADEELELGNLYVMFPVRRANSVVTAADVAVFLMANSAPRRINGGASVKVSPEKVTEVPDVDESSGNGLPGFSFEGAAMEFQYRLAACRSKRPGLDTIVEDPLFPDNKIFNF